MYRERASQVPGAYVWTLQVGVGDVDSPVLPDGCMDLIWTDDRLIVAGPDTAAYHSAAPPGTTYTGLRFAPGAAPAVLGVTAHELRDQRVALADLWPAGEVHLVTERVGDATTRGTALEAVAADLMREGAVPDPVVGAILRRLSIGTSVTETASAVGLSERQLRRRCLDWFGYGPKMLVRILRMQRALALARAGTPFARVAASAGYADQAHLARDVKDLAGTTLSALTA